MPTTTTETGRGIRRGRAAAVACACIAAGLAFGAVLWRWRGPEPAQQYLAGYLIELSLSVDNVFVFVLVFDQFGLAPRRQGRLLLWGILGAVVLRSAFLLAGLGATARFAWLIPVFGALILATGIRLAFSHHARKAPDPEGRLFRLVTRHLPAAVAAVVVIELVDLVFALDSLPAVLAVTHDRLVAITSNLFAILGLRSLFTLVSGAMKSLRFLSLGLAAVLSFVGLKMLAEPWHPVPTGVSLAVIAALLLSAVSASLAFPRPPTPVPENSP
jgi:tellurite resistance protein TerC